MREMKDSGTEWIGKMPDAWRTGKIGELYELRNEKVSDKDYPPLSVTMKGIVPQLETAAKTDDGDNRKLVRKGDFSINSRSDRRGSCGISAYDGSVSLINTVLKPRTTMMPEYYNWLFHAPLFSDEFYRWGHGIVDDLWTTGWTDMKKISIPVPPSLEQRRIAAFLDAKCAEIDALTADVQSQIDTLEQYKRSMITEAVTKGLNPDVEMKDSYAIWIGKIPVAWNIIPAKYVMTIKNGSDPKSEGDIPVYGSGAGSFKTCGEYKEGPTVLLGRKGATLHIPHFIEGRYWNVDTAFDAHEKNAMMLLRFYYYLAICFDYKYYISQTTLPGMTQTNYGNMRLPMPEIVEQKEIVSYLDAKCTEIDKVISDKQTQLKILDDYKKSLIYEYVTGKKEVTV
ncbi:restriction endonuclease subunit S [Sporolactobacillus shoreae]|uniref:Restriction endonuclease subunit S n=1 Tax=Sporolactobacillus shoreae TaxID=1465501 RepID=A0A4Z0GJW4_9BACL|nr:restriction endonuclease subunit S [Sporolactobacillus shoreae]TGA96336.1 restriction endonuclease subunit S [Sporolactobacillus shoreae]